jgi:hypothetical protein
VADQHEVSRSLRRIGVAAAKSNSRIIVIYGDAIALRSGSRRYKRSRKNE